MSNPIPNRVVVTGMGVVAPNGQSVGEFWASLKSGKSGLSSLEGIGPDGFRDLVTAPLGGQIKSFDQRTRLAHLKRDKILPHSERYSWLAGAAAHEATEQARLQVPHARPERVAVIVGTATGGQATVETACRDHHLRQVKATHPLVLIRLIPSSAAAHVGIEYGAKGPVLAITSACASADHAITLGFEYIRNGLVDVAIVGGTEAAISLAIVVAMQSADLLTHDAVRPFAANSSGTVLSEAAGLLVLESRVHAVARGAKPLAELLGIGMTSNAVGDLSPDPAAAAKAMSAALAVAGLEPSRIDYLNAFGAATLASDRAETAAIKQAFGAHARQLSISSTKPVHGYAMGATGALETIACIKAIEEGFVPPTMGLDVADPACDLDFTPNTGRSRRIDYAMTVTQALGGLNTALVLGRPE